MNKYISIGVSFAALIIILLVAIKYCTGGKTYTQTEFDQQKKQHALEDSAYVDTIEFVRNERDLQQEKVIAQQTNVWLLERKFDSLYAKHMETKKKLKSVNSNVLDNTNDTGFVLAPNEYVDECEECFNSGKKLKQENAQLKFERDSYDNIRRTQSSIDSSYILKLLGRNALLTKTIDSVLSIDNTKRKVKLSIIGMGGNVALPWGGGAGLLYEDKKENLFGGHVLFTNQGLIYMFNCAKTISFKHKK